MNLYVIQINQVGGNSGIIAKDNKTYFFTSEKKAREYGRKFVEGSIFMLTSWGVISRKSAREGGYQINQEPVVIDPTT